MALTEEEKAKIIEEEKLRAEYRKKAHKDAMDERDAEQGTAALGIFIGMGLVVLYQILK